jgi:H/ACA ribonucleoprotein complex subunit 4
MKEKPIHELLNFSVLNLDKSSGPTSFSVSDFVRKQLAGLGVNKTSHFGTLDPRVTGVLPIALGRACKLTGFFLGHDKTYVGIMHVHNEVSLEKLQEIINKKFIGKIIQLPPKKSRVKRQEREREIISFDLLEQDGKNILFKTKVQGGTYIRKLISDLGDEKEVNGAHMLELRRTEAGIFSENDKEFVNLYDFQKAIENQKQLRKILIPAEEAIKKVMPVFQLKRKDELKKLLTGKPVFENILSGETKKLKIGEIFAIFDGEKFIEIAKRVDEGEIFARSEFVYN